MGTVTNYVFRSVWSVEAGFDDVCSVLVDVRTYPAWWPEIRTVTELGRGRFELVARSLLPYELRFVSEESAGSRCPGVIDARLSGDLEGFARWSVAPAGTMCTVVYDQEVDTHKALHALAPVARPAFRVNHAPWPGRAAHVHGRLHPRRPATARGLDERARCALAHVTSAKVSRRATRSGTA